MATVALIQHIDLLQYLFVGYEAGFAIAVCDYVHVHLQRPRTVCEAVATVVYVCHCTAHMALGLHVRLLNVLADLDNQYNLQSEVQNMPCERWSAVGLALGLF